jgi:Ca2+-transporting ATPase
MPMPLKPLQILWLNLVTDVFPALALGMERYAGDVMDQRPRPRSEPFLGRRQYLNVLGYGSLIALTVLVAFMGARRMFGPEKTDEAVSVAFYSLALAQLFFVLSVKSDRGLLDLRGLFTNKWVWLSVLWCTLLSVGVVFVPGLKDVLRVKMLPAAGWQVVAVASVIPFLVGFLVDTLVAASTGRGRRRSQRTVES